MDDGTDDVPEAYRLQCLWNLACVRAATGANIQHWDLAAAVGIRDGRWYRTHWGEAEATRMLEANEDWWDNYVLPDVPPPVDGSEGAARMLKALHPADDGEMIDGTEHAALIEELRSARAVREAAEAAEAATVNRIKELIADHAGMYGPWGKISWKKTKDTTSTDWKGVVDALCRHLLVGADVRRNLEAAHTTTRPGIRRFLPTFKA